MSKPEIFKSRARLIFQIGDQLIKNESIALLELVKNAYDADASTVDIVMEKLHDPKTALITIKDNGTGMNEDIIRGVWLEIGSDNKEILLKHIKKRDAKVSRRPLGEKGLGRFSAHKLGRHLELTTRMKDQDEVVVTIDWRAFEIAKYVEDVPINIKSVKPTVFTGRQTGTFIKIRDLRPYQWSDQVLKDVYRSISTISSPFEAPDSFKVSFNLDKPEILRGLPTLEDVKDLSLYRFECAMENDLITHFEYKFTPYKSMDKLKQRRLVYDIDDDNSNINGFETINQMVETPKRNAEKDKKESPIIDLSANGMEIGIVRFEGMIFDRQSKVLKFGGFDSKTLKNYLDQNGGIRVYRDGVRVYDYGEQENDWLGLEKGRLYDPGVRINKGLILAAVHLDRNASESLVEKTNREGFVDNAAYKTLTKAVKYALRLVETYRNEDKEQVRLNYGLSPKTEPVLASVNDLREIIEDKVQNPEVQKECLRYLNKIEKDYESINEILLTSAEAGLNLSVAIHEIEKIVSELGRVVQSDNASSNIVKLIEHLTELIEMYATLTRKGKSKIADLRILVADALFHVKYRLKAHKVEIVDEYSKFKGESDIKCISRLAMGSILNVIDNSIYWLERAKIKNKKIIISLRKSTPKYIELIIADNGNGFALPPEQMIKPFVGLRPGGMGLGLHIANEVIAQQGGVIEFPKFKDADLSREYSKGAIVSLNFKKGE
jgi:anti-sigma regulatory factor (Ser/Thr protein kinase)